MGRSTLESGTYTFTDDYHSGTGLKNLLYRWIALYNPKNKWVDFYLFTYRPQKLQYVIENIHLGVGNFLTADLKTFITADQKTFNVNIFDRFITKLVLYPGNGHIYHGRIIYSDLVRDTNSDKIPDFLDINSIGSLTRFLRPYGVV